VTMLDVRGSIECAGCGRPFGARRVTARYCSSSCRAKAGRAAKLAFAPPDVPQPVLSVRGPPACQSDTADGHPGDITPLRYRAALGDKDIRDIKGPAPGAEIDMPDLPACLDRRSLRPDGRLAEAA